MALRQAQGERRLLSDQHFQRHPATDPVESVGRRRSAPAHIRHKHGLATTAGIIPETTVDRLSVLSTYRLTPRLPVIKHAGADNSTDIFHTLSFH